MKISCGVFVFAAALLHGQTYDLLIKGGHVIDPKNNVDGIMDVAVSGEQIARVARDIPQADARRVVNAKGLYVVPGLVDIHVHVYSGTGLPRVLTGDSSVYPDGFGFRTGVTTMVDAGTAGWRNFPDFKQRVIDRAQTRVLAMLNIAAGGMGPAGEQDPNEMDARKTAEVAKAYPEIVVGVKTAHYGGPEWISVERAVEAGKLANIPVMVDFGSNREERPISTLFMDKLRPGDIYTHVFSGLRNELLPDGKISPALFAGRKRGIIFDVGHGGGSFRWNVATAAMQQGFVPDVISTDLHTGSMNAGMKDMTNVMAKFLNLGVPIQQVIRMSTSAPAEHIKRPELGHIGARAGADITLLSVEEGKFGFVDSRGARFDGTKWIHAEMTIRDGQVMWDRNGRASEEWKAFYSRPEPKQRRRRSAQ